MLLHSMRLLTDLAEGHKSLCYSAASVVHASIWRQTFPLQTTSSQEPLVQFQPKLAGNIPGGWGFSVVQIKGQNKENYDKS